MAAQPFKVIVIGGGPAGLAAAHALHLAGVDFVILERRGVVVEDVGASLVLMPPSLRVMHQFGLLDKLRAIGTEVDNLRSLDREGKVFKDTKNVLLLREYFGATPMVFHRADLVRILYEGLPKQAKDKIIIGKKAVDITQTEDSITVSCEDGTSYNGAIVIGADGVYSKTRQIIRKTVLESNPRAAWDEERPFKSTYRCVWCSFPLPTSSKPGINSETQHNDRSVMFLTGREKAWIFLYEKLPTPTKERVTYKDSDVDAFATQFKDWPITEDLKVSDVFNRASAGMSNLDEGILDHWHHGRVALVGDACHKFTPNAGLGLNSGIQDVVAICNRLRDLVHGTSDGQPATSALDKAFGEYREARLARLHADYTRSAAMTRMHAWANTIYWIMARFIMASTLVELFFVKFVAPKNLRQGLVLDYVRGEEPLMGTKTWLHPIKPMVAKEID